jgi:chorismate dehydratase
MPDVTHRHARLGCVSYLNSRPLIHGLDDAEDLTVIFDVPSALLEGLRAARYDVALLPVIDYQRMEGLRIIPAGGIGCDGPTLTVRIFSRVPLEKMTGLWCDPDSHTSVALARIVLAERFGIQPPFFSGFDPSELSHGSLLIGDKVVSAAPAGFNHQLDLGEAWKDLTGLPFVFAVWTARPGVGLGDLPARLAAAWPKGLERVEDIVTNFAVPRGWPVDLARTYLVKNLQFAIGPTQLQAISRFHQMAARHGLTAPGLLKPLVVEGDPTPASLA